MARVFTAVNIDDQQILEELKQVRDRLDLGFKPVNTDKMHITFQFFKDINQEQIKEVKKAIENISINSFNVEIKGVGAFPSNDYIRVIWAGAEHQKLYTLKNQLSNHEVENDNDHSFKPHVTLLRVEDVHGEEKRKLKKTLQEFQNHRFGSLTVDEVKLYRSDLNPKGARYKQLAAKKL
ncbi:MAG: RNA 2',3'-cyclic phosphodiesterase [Candidatus Nanohaloarchaea archaeon]